jgi:hypothetical protein
MISAALARLPRVARQAIALLLPVIVVIAGMGVVKGVESGARSQAVWRDAAREALATGASARDTVPDITAAIDALPGEPIWSRLYSGESAEANQAALLADVSQVLAQSGIQGPEVEPIPTRQTDNLHVWSCEVSFQADAAQLHTLGQQLRAWPRYVRVKGIVMTGPQMQTLGDNPASTVRMVLEGFGVVRKAIAAEREQP